MIVTIVIFISALLQFAASFVALRLMNVTGKALSWGLIALAIFLMAIRRSVTLLKIIQAQHAPPMELSIELIALLISILMLTGLILIFPLFNSLQSNIIKLKYAQKISSENENKLKNITSSIAEGIYVKNYDGSLLFMNKEAERITGWTFEELKDENIHNKIHHRMNAVPEPIENCKLIEIFKTGVKFYSTDLIFTRKDGSEFPISVISSPIFEGEKIVSVVTAFSDITERKQLEMEKESLIKELQQSLETIKTLHGILPICASCKKIKDDKDNWTQIEEYITSHTEADFSHGICPECAKKLYPEIYEE